MTPQLQKKVDFAIKLLQSIPNDEPIEVSYSSGKDSDVILELARMAGINYRAIYKNTTIDPPGTIAHCKSKGVEVFAPKMRFFELVERKGIPTMRARFCCEVLKEYKVLDRAIQGIRRCESVKRAARYKEPEICRAYSAKDKVKVYLPILEWADDDVVEFIKERGIKCHPHYYDEQGNFHVERRLGCIGCPLQGDRGKSDYLKYPKMLKQLIKSEQIYLDTHPHVRAVEKFGNAYNVAFQDLFYPPSWDTEVAYEFKNLSPEQVGRAWMIIYEKKIVGWAGIMELLQRLSDAGLRGKFVSRTQLFLPPLILINSYVEKDK